MNNRIFALAGLAALVSLAACKKDEPAAPVGNARIQFVNAAPGQNLDIYENNTRTHDNLGYKANTLYKQVQATGRSIQVTANGTIDPKLVTLTLNPPNNSTQTIFLNKQATGTTNLNALVLTDTITGGTSGKAMVRFVNLAPAAGSVQFTKAGTLSGSISNSRGYREFTSYSALDPGSLNADIRSGGNTYFAKDVTLAAGKFYTLALVGEPAGPSGGTSTLDMVLITNE